MNSNIVKQVMREMGRKGGTANTPAQNAARSENGKKGGRPKKATGSRGRNPNAESRK